MIYTKTITLNGKQYNCTYSNRFYIERDGAQYIEAIDPLNSDRVYIETNTLLPVEEITSDEALNIITGGEEA